MYCGKHIIEYLFTMLPSDRQMGVSSDVVPVGTADLVVHHRRDVGGATLWVAAAPLGGEGYKKFVINNHFLI